MGTILQLIPSFYLNNIGLVRVNEFVKLESLKNYYMERRKFLIGIGSVTVLTLSGAAYYITQPLAYDGSIAEPQLLSQIWDSETILSIGSTYVSETPDENSENILAKTLLENMSGSPEEMVKSLNEKVTNDFQKGDIVMIEGWILSRTEARQCGLLSKTQIK